MPSGRPEAGPEGGKGEGSKLKAVGTTQLPKEVGYITDHTSYLTDFAQTAALISCLDLVITIDTSVAHIAGALGRPVWFMLQRNADWRWFVGRNDSPWYPTARLFRQERQGSWDEVIMQIAQSLNCFP